MDNLLHPSLAVAVARSCISWRCRAAHECADVTMHSPAFTTDGQIGRTVSDRRDEHTMGGRVYRDRLYCLDSSDDDVI
jgi:hypothetical protein